MASMQPPVRLAGKARSHARAGRAECRLTAGRSRGLRRAGLRLGCGRSAIVPRKDQGQRIWSSTRGPAR